jgi:hypothetical protein
MLIIWLRTIVPFIILGITLDTAEAIDSSRGYFSVSFRGGMYSKKIGLRSVLYEAN